MANKPSHPKLSAFTLLELLVVMSVISMLMAIVMPSFRHARENGRATVCLSNLRQFNMACSVYASNNNEKLCAADTLWNGIQPWDEETNPYGVSHFWVSDGPGVAYNAFCGTELAIKKGVLWPYVENLDIYKCLSDKSGFVRSYAILSAMGSIINYNGERNFYRTNEITMSSERGVFMEVEIPPERSMDGDMTGVGKLGASRFIDTFSNTWLRGITLLTYRHNNGCNISFADGHVEPYKWQDKRTTTLIDHGGDELLEDFAVNNPDIDNLLPVVRGAGDRKF